VFKKFLSIGKTIHDGIKAIPDAMGINGPGGMTFATPSGATVTGALEAVPAISVEGTGAGIITSAAGGILPPDDFTSLSFARKTDGRDHTPNVGKAGQADRPTPIERKIDTPEIRNSFWDQLKQSGEWEHVTGYDNPTLRHKETGRLIQKSIEKWEIEVYNKKKEHIGVIKPSAGILREDLAVKGRTINK
jgi:hypothetical protein